MDDCPDENILSELLTSGRPLLPEIERHVVRCDLCQPWLQSYRESLARRARPDEPESPLEALYAVFGVSTHQPAALVGKLIDNKYEITGLIGEGGMAAVFEAVHRKLGKVVALKILHPRYACRSDVIARFWQEGKVISKLQHPHIISVIDMVSYRQNMTDILVMVLERLRGGNLRERLKADHHLPWQLAIEFLVPIMNALTCAHVNGIIHRDVTPANIFLAKGSEPSIVPKLIDFGVAKIIDSQSQALGLTRSGATVGTPLYMAPEQLRRGQQADARTDIWAIGTVFYETLSGKRPFDANDVMELASIIMDGPPEPLLQLVPDLPPALATAVHQALQRAPEDRWQSIEEFHHALLKASAPGSPAKARWGQRARALSVVGGLTALGAVGYLNFTGQPFRHPTPVQLPAPTEPVPKPVRNQEPVWVPAAPTEKQPAKPSPEPTRTAKPPQPDSEQPSDEIAENSTKSKRRKVKQVKRLNGIDVLPDPKH